MWQPPQVVVKISLPARGGRLGLLGSRRRLLRPDELRPDHQHGDREGGDEPRHRREHPIDRVQHQGDGIPLVVMNQRPLVTQVATSSVNTRPPAIGSQMPARRGMWMIVTFVAKAP